MVREGCLLGYGPHGVALRRRTADFIVRMEIFAKRLQLLKELLPGMSRWPSSGRAGNFNTQRSRPLRSPATHQVRAGDQSRDGEGNLVHRAGRPANPRRPGDRVALILHTHIAACAHGRFWHLTDDVALGRNLVRNLAYMRPRAMVLRDPP